jgi:hypothetical protein
MRIFIILSALILLLAVTVSCSSSTNNSTTDKILQEADGTISLKLEKAALYNCESNPANNTAEWSFVVSKPGRYGVWLSTATTDTMNLKYSSPVKINLQDERIEAKPVGDKIVLNTNDVKYPYFRADSYIGTFYIESAGEYSIQVINEKVISGVTKTADEKSDTSTRMMSLVLTPMTR